MPRSLHNTIAWSLIAALTMVAGVGEALHCIPGCGHGIQVGDRVEYVGVCVPCGDGAGCRDAAGGHRSRVERPEGPEIPIIDERQCAICLAAGQSCTSGDSAPFVSVTPLAHDLPTVALAEFPAAAARRVQARAPPLA